MKNTGTADWATGVIMLMLVLVGFFALTGNANARQELVPVEGVSFNVSASMANNLRTLKGKTINVMLASGQSMTGVLKDVGDKLIHLEKLVGKEYFDALISIDDINSVDTRFRSYKR